jgi:prepilin-type processing-associated H-X9-DG protein
VAQGGAFPQGVFRINLATGLSEAQIPVASGQTGEIDILQVLASNGTDLFVAIDRNYAVPTPAEHVIVRFDPASFPQVPLSPSLLTTTGQSTRLDFGGGYLWVFANPNVQKVDPLSGTMLASYCKSDGGANILYYGGHLWSIKDNILLAYQFN